MEINKKDLLLAAEKTTLEPREIESLWAALEQQKLPSTEKITAPNPELSAAKVTYYVGAFIALFSLPLFLSQLWERIGYGGSLAIFAAYASAFAFFGWKLSAKKEEKIAGGVLWTLFLCMIPFIVYCGQQLLGLWPTTSEFLDFFNNSKVTASNAIVIELTTLFVGFVVLAYNRLPLLLFPISLALWLLFSDLAILFFRESIFDMHLYKWSSLAAGIALILLGMLFQWKESVSPFWAYFFGLFALESALVLFLYKTEVDRLLFYYINVFLLFLSVGLKSRVFAILVACVLFSSFGALLYFNEPTLMMTKTSLIIIGILIVLFGLLSKKQQFLPAHWFYLLGLIAFEIGISFLWNGSEIKRFAFCLINFFLIFLSLFFDSHLFTLFGGIAIFVYLSYLASTIFSGSILFPFALIAIGALIFSFGIFYSRYFAKWRLFLLDRLPWTNNKI